MKESMEMGEKEEKNEKVDEIQTNSDIHSYHRIKCLSSE